MKAALHTQNGGQQVDTAKVFNLDHHRIVAGKADPASKPFAPGAIQGYRRPGRTARRIAIGLAVAVLAGLAGWACVAGDLSSLPSIHGLSR